MPLFQITRRMLLARQYFEMRLVWLTILLFPTLVWGQAGLEPLLKAVENHYNRATSIQLDFSESYAAYHRPSRAENGVLYLRKPGKMRWEYANPAGKVFLSDGKDVFQYSPDESQAIKSKLKESDDMRAPLAFLLGKLDFAKEFKSFQTNADAAGTWIVVE